MIGKMIKKNTLYTCMIFSKCKKKNTSNILREWWFKDLRENETEGINKYKRFKRVVHVKAIIR